MRPWIPIVLVLAVAACGTPQQQGTPASEIGLSKGEITDVLTPDPVTPEASEPGEVPATPAAFADAPPMIPHGLVDFLPIVADSNMCVECHAVEEKIDGEPTPIPVSHYTDLRNTPGEIDEEVVGARWVCTSCHAGLTDAPPLVPNRFDER